MRTSRGAVSDVAVMTSSSGVVKVAVSRLPRFCSSVAVEVGLPESAKTHAAFAGIENIKCLDKYAGIKIGKQAQVVIGVEVHAEVGWLLPVVLGKGQDGTSRPRQGESNRMDYHFQSVR